MSGFLKFSGFKQLLNILPTSWIVGYDGDSNVKFTFADLVKRLNVDISTSQGAPIYFDGNQLPDKDNLGNDLNKGNWVFVTEGTYQNINGGLPIVIDSGNFGYIIYNGTTWSLGSSVPLPQASNGKTIENFDPTKVGGYTVGSQIFYKGEIFEVVTQTSAGESPENSPSKYKLVLEGSSGLASSIGVGIDYPVDNIISELAGSNLNNTELWSVGYLNRNTAPSTGVQTFRFSKKYYPISAGRADFKVAIYGNAVICFYDSNLNIIGYLERGSLSTTMFITNFTVPNGTVYFRVSHYYGTGTGDGTAAGGQPTDIYVRKSDKSYIPTGNVFVLSNQFDSKTKDLLKNSFGVQITPSNTEFISKYISSSVLNTELWLPGFLRANGTIENGANWYHTKDYIRLKAGTYNYRFFFTGNARAILYNINTYAVDQLLSSSLPADLNEGTFTITEDKWFKFSHRENATQPNRIDQITLKNSFDINPKIITTNNIYDYTSQGTVDLRKVYKDTYKPKKRRKIASFICDDGHINDKNWYIPLLNEYGLKSSLAICKQWARQGNASSRLSEQEIIDYFKAGHDIVNHTLTHQYLNQLTLDEAEEQVLGNKLYLETLLNAECELFVSPFGIRNANLDYIISKYHKANFISGYAVNNPTPLDSFFINRVSFDAAESGVLIFDTKLKPAIDEATINNQWLVFAVHSGYAEYNLSNTVDRRQELRQTIEYLIAQGFEIMTAKRAFSYYKNYVEIGVKRYNPNYYQLGMDLSENNIGYF